VLTGIVVSSAVDTNDSTVVVDSNAAVVWYSDDVGITSCVIVVDSNV
jgi:hypothetical protein